MSQSVKSVLALVILITLGAGVLGWTTKGIEGVPDSQFWMRLAPIVTVLSLAVLIWADFRKDKAPDFLRRLTGSYFERNGLCFSISPSTSNGICYWVVLFQNRYERTCHGSIGLRPAVGNLGVIRPSLDEVHFELQCDGGAFGIATMPFGVAAKYQGKKLSFELAAQTNYLDGRGQLLRFRDGVRVGSRNKSGLDTTLTVVSGLSGHMHFTSQAKFRAQMPQGVSESVESTTAAESRILWRPGMPEAGVVEQAAEVQFT